MNIQQESQNDHSESDMLTEISRKDDDSRKEEKLLVALRNDQLNTAVVHPSKEAKKEGGYLFTLLFVIMTSQLMFLNISTFLPIHIDDANLDLDSGYFAIVLAMYQVSRLILSPFIGSSMHKVGRKNYIIIGFLFMIFSTVGFGALDFVTNKWLFFSGALIFRFIQGIGGTCLQVAS